MGCNFTSFVLRNEFNWNFCTKRLNYFAIFWNKKGEKYKIVYKDIEIAKIKCRQKTCIYYVKIPLDKVKKNDIIDLHIFRKGKFGIFYRYTELFISYKSGFEYLSFFRNYRLKNRYALDYFWSNGRVYSE